jgi:hypothetical protein
LGIASTSLARSLPEIAPNCWRWAACAFATYRIGIQVFRATRTDGELRAFNLHGVRDWGIAPAQAPESLADDLAGLIVVNANTRTEAVAGFVHAVVALPHQSASCLPSRPLACRRQSGR